jgi:hypothetical protein
VFSHQSHDQYFSDWRSHKVGNKKDPSKAVKCRTYAYVFGSLLSFKDINTSINLRRTTKTKTIQDIQTVPLKIQNESTLINILNSGSIIIVQKRQLKLKIVAVLMSDAKLLKKTWPQTVNYCLKWKCSKLRKLLMSFIIFDSLILCSLLIVCSQIKNKNNSKA